MPRRTPFEPDARVLDHLGSFVEVLWEKRQTSIHSAPLVIAMVGAGASAPAGLPVGPELKKMLRKEMCPPGGHREIVDAELMALFGQGHANITPDQIFDRISVFEFVAAVTRSDWGRQRIGRAIEQVMGTATHRPLAYEIAAHLAKHRHIDHFIVLNFDTLLDEAVEDELPERRKLVVSERDVPADVKSFLSDRCYLVHPFGRLNHRPYSLSLEDVASRLGPEVIDRFLRLHLPNTTAGAVHLLTLGYAGAEPCFELFLRALCVVPRSGEPRRVIVHCVDLGPTPPAPLQEKYARVHADAPQLDLHHVRTDADTAMELLLHLLDARAHKEKIPAWVPGARHKLISNCFTNVELRDHRKRFAIELLLQAVKSRGFVHLEAFSHVRRLREYGGSDAGQVVEELLDREVLKRDYWLGVHGEGGWLGAHGERPRSRYVPNYMVPRDETGERTDLEKVIEALSEISAGATGQVPIYDCSIVEGRFRCDLVSWPQYVKGRLEEIERAPDIEVDPKASPETHWLLGSCEALPSLDRLVQRTREMLSAALHEARDHAVKIRGLWSTGEWLFHDQGWAQEWGRKLLNNRNVSFEIVITAEGGVRGERSVRREDVMKVLEDHPRVTRRTMNWWELNRILTLVSSTGPAGKQAIYMKRRLARPTVSPYFVRADHGIAYLEEVFESYFLDRSNRTR